MRDYLPLLAVAAGLVAVVGAVLAAFWLFFKLVAWLRTRRPSWRSTLVCAAVGAAGLGLRSGTRLGAIVGGVFGTAPWVVCYFARHWRWRNQITVFRASWFLPGYKRRYPRVLLNMTDNGPTSFTRQWTKNYKTNVKRGTRNWNSPGPGSMRWGREEKELPGDVAKLPACTWHKTGQYADEVSDEHGDFPIWEGTAYDGWTPLRHRKPGTERAWIYWWEGSELAHFRSWVDMLKAVGWEPVVAQKKHQATAAPEYTEWPDEMFEART